MRRLTARERLVIGLLAAVAVAALVVVRLGDGEDDVVSSSGSRTTGAETTGSSAAPGVPPSTSETTTTTPSVPARPPPTPAPSTTTVAPGPAVAVRRGSPDRSVVALTFDAGSDTGYAAEILDVLAANHVPATFGMTGKWADANPALVRRMASEGHQLVNHSYDHPSFTGRSTDEPALSRAQRLDQLARADAAIRRAAGVTTVPWFRPPYGDEDESVRADVATAGYRYELMWTVDSLGWKGVASDDVVRRCLDGAVPGAIYLFHVGAASTDHAALQRIIDGLRGRGYGFTTADALVTG
jgi:peptidoglycan/xylan/chitin deacetylase (PgdA/CDA1 family)